MNEVTVWKGRTNVLEVSLSYDVSNDTITSEIRQGRSLDTMLIAAWQVTYKTDGTDGNLILTLDDSVTTTIEDTIGYMDIKRVSGSEPYSVLDAPLTVIFKDVITA